MKPRLQSKRVLSALIATCLLIAMLLPGVAAACEGGGEEEGKVSISPTSHNYGSVKTGQKATETFTVSTTFSSAEIDPTGFGVKIKNVKGLEDFFVSNNGCKQVTIKPGSPCTIKVVFEPSLTGLYEGILEVRWQVFGGLGSGTAKATLTGTGI